MKKLLLSITFFILIFSFANAQNEKAGQDDYQKHLKTFYKHVSSDDLMGYIQELSAPEYEGRLVGSKGMEKAADWCVDVFEQWDIPPFGDDNSYIQVFPYPSTEVSDANVLVHIPVGDTCITKGYEWADWYAGGTSGSGEITAEVVYAGFGVIAPELGYNDYEGIDVKGKIVLIEGELPVRPTHADSIAAWYKHTLHQTKHQNAINMGAVGMLYRWVAGPNNGYDKDFIYCYVNAPIVNDIFAGTGTTYKETVAKIRKTRKPASFNTGKKATIMVESIHNPDAEGKNILGIIEGTDPKLKDEYVIITAHIDHLGMIPHLIAGSNDNLSATAALLGIAKTIVEGEISTKRSIIFMHVDAEEAGLGGSTYYCENPLVPKEQVVAIINLESVGVGSAMSISVGAGTPLLGDYFEDINDKYIGRQLRIGKSKHLTRPRTDGAVFMKNGYPTADIFSSGVGPGGKRYYHHPGDNIDQITPDLLYDATKLAFLTTLKLANTNKIVVK